MRLSYGRDDFNLMNPNLPYSSGSVIPQPPMPQPIQTIQQNSPIDLNFVAGGIAPAVAAGQSTPGMAANNAFAKQANIAPQPGTEGGFWGGFNKIFGSDAFANSVNLISSLGSLYGGIRQLGLAKDALNFQKEAFNTNLNNQRQSYNTALEDRARARYAQEGSGQAAADDYVRRNRL